MSIHAAFVAAAASFTRRSAQASWLSSNRSPCDFITRNNCSMTQRCWYHPTICHAPAASVISCVVSSRQCSGSTPSGGLTSRTSISRRRTVGGRVRSSSSRGRQMSTSPCRSSTTAVRLGCAGSCARSSMVRRPTTGNCTAAVNSVPPPASARSDIARPSIWKFASGTVAHAGSMSASRSATTVTLAAELSTDFACCAVSTRGHATPAMRPAA